MTHDSTGLGAIHVPVSSAGRRGHGLPMRRGSVIRDHHEIEAAAVPCDHPDSGARFGTGRACEQLFQEQRQIFTADPEAAAKLLAVGEVANSPEFSPIDLAAGTVLAEALLNHDEAIMKR